MNFRLVILKTNFRYKELIKSLVEAPDPFQQVTGDKSENVVEIKQEPIDAPQTIQELELNVKEEPIETFEEVDVQDLLVAPKAEFPPTEIIIEKPPQAVPKKNPVAKTQSNQLTLTKIVIPVQKKVFICVQCNAKFDEERKIVEHVKIEHKSRKQLHKSLGCTECPEKFFNDYDRQSHIAKIHGKNKNLKPEDLSCIVCHEEFEFEIDRIKHERKLFFTQRKFFLSNFVNCFSESTSTRQKEANTSNSKANTSRIHIARNGMAMCLL
jgi:hypothetical protein